MWTKLSVIAFVAALAISSDASAGTRHSRGRARPIFSRTQPVAVPQSVSVATPTAIRSMYQSYYAAPAGQSVVASAQCQCECRRR